MKHYNLTKKKMVALNNERFAKSRNRDNLKLRTRNFKLQFTAFSFARKILMLLAKGLYQIIEG